MMRAGHARHVLVIGAEVYTRIVDWTDRGTCVLFGDGAGAVLLSAGEGAGTNKDRGLLSTHLHADGRHGDILVVEGGAGSTGVTGRGCGCAVGWVLGPGLGVGAVVVQAASASASTAACSGANRHSWGRATRKAGRQAAATGASDAKR